jgi:hypothetical protein
MFKIPGKEIRTPARAIKYVHRGSKMLGEEI